MLLIFKYLIMVIVYIERFIISKLLKIPDEDFPKFQYELLSKAKDLELINIYQYQSPYIKPDEEMQKDFENVVLIKVGIRYLISIYYGLKRVFFNRNSIPILDEDFYNIIESNLFSKFLIEKNSNKIIDLSIYKDFKSYPGLYNVGTKLIFKKHHKSYLLSQIEVHDNETIRLLNKNSKLWNLAKLYAMKNIVHETNLGLHATTHFPTMAILVSGLNKLPFNHPIRNMLCPHIKYTVGVNASVLINKLTSIVVEHSDPSSPFDNSLAGFHEIIERNNRNFPFKLDEDFPSTSYGRLMNKYKFVIRNFVTEFIISWIIECEEKIYGFPKIENITIEILIQLLTTIIQKVTVEHFAEHYLTSKINSIYKPWRIRIPFPREKTEVPNINLSNLNWKVDAYQEETSNHIFFDIVTSSSLLKLKYYNDSLNHEKSLITYDLDYEKFYNELKKVSTLLPVDQIPWSIDF
jgi:hypothetical protein